jgi:serine/threonine-protein kinase ULK2
VPEREVQEIAAQIVEGMSHLFSLGVVHRDLKLANLLLHLPNMEGREGEITDDWFRRRGNSILREDAFSVKIADLGFSKIQDDIYTDLNSTYCGTPINMAPEVLSREMYNYKADVWSVGTIVYELLTGYSPFRDAVNKDQLKKRHQQPLVFPKDLFIS